MLSIATLYLPAGLAIGFAAAAPMGPVNLLVIQRALGRQNGAALLIGFGAALGDALFAIIAAFGLAAVARLLDQHETALRIAGGLVMLGFAALVWRAAPHIEAGPAPERGARLVALGFSAAATNPAGLLFFVGSFGAIGFLGLGHDTGAHRINSALLVFGVFIGAMVWWVTVSGIARRLRGRLSDGHLRLLNHGTAAALALFGLGAAALGVASL